MFEEGDVELDEAVGAGDTLAVRREERGVPSSRMLVKIPYEHNVA